MDAKLTIHFRQKDNGTTLATAVMVMAGAGGPEFYRVTLDEGVDPMTLYNQVAAQAVGHILKHKPTGDPGQAGQALQGGKLIQLRGVLPMD
jgi:hypothetical protein